MKISQLLNEAEDLKLSQHLDKMSANIESEFEYNKHLDLSHLNSKYADSPEVQSSILGLLQSIKEADIKRPYQAMVDTAKTLPKSYQVAMKNMLGPIIPQKYSKAVPDYSSILSSMVSEPYVAVNYEDEGPAAHLDNLPRTIQDKLWQDPRFIKHVLTELRTQQDDGLINVMDYIPDHAWNSQPLRNAFLKNYNKYFFSEDHWEPGDNFLRYPDLKAAWEDFYL